MPARKSWYLLRRGGQTSPGPRTCAELSSSRRTHGWARTSPRRDSSQGDHPPTEVVNGWSCCITSRRWGTQDASTRRPGCGHRYGGREQAGDRVTEPRAGPGPSRPAALARPTSPSSHRLVYALRHMRENYSWGREVVEAFVTSPATCVCDGPDDRQTSFARYSTSNAARAICIRA